MRGENCFFSIDTFRKEFNPNEIDHQKKEKTVNQFQDVTVLFGLPPSLVLPAITILGKFCRSKNFEIQQLQ